MKKIFTYILIAIFVLAASYTVITPHTASAGCDFTSTVTGNFSITDCFGNVGFLILTIMSKVVWLAGTLLNFSLHWTLNISMLLDSVPAIKDAWIVVRDLSSMFFIFLLLYQAISIILGVTGFGSQNLLKNIIIAGLLVNFSFFFTTVIIDASNIVSLQFYNALTPNKGHFDGGLSDIFMQQLSIQSTYDHTTNAFGPQIGNNQPSGVNSNNIMIITVLGSITMLIAAFVFFAAACLFAIRLVMLIILLALSPVMVLGGVLPETKKYQSDWWDQLNKQALFAPMYLLITYLGIRILNGTGFKHAIGADKATFAAAFTGAGADSVAIALNFLIVIIFLIAALIMADRMGVEGAGTLKKWGKSLSKWGQGVAGRNTIGRAAKLGGSVYDNVEARLKQHEGFNEFAKVANIATLGAAGTINRGIRSGIQAGENAKFGSNRSLADVRKEIKERNKTISGEQRKIELNRVLDQTGPSPDLAQHDRLRKEVVKLSGKELEKMKLAQLTNPQFAGHLNSSQMDTLLKSDEFNDAEKTKIKDAREKGLLAMVNNSRVGAQGLLANRKPEDIAKLPGKILTNPQVAPHLSANVLAKIARDGTLNDAERDTIRSHFESYLGAAGTVPSADFDKAYDWLNTGPGQTIF